MTSNSSLSELEGLKSAFNSLPEPLLVISRSGTVIFANVGFNSLVGSTESGDRVGRFWPDVDKVTWEYREFASEFIKADGSPFPVKLVTYPGDLLLVRVIGSIDSLHDRRFTHQQRLETLGMLAGGVTHDFNNVLTGIIGHIAYLKTILPEKGQHSESIAAVEDGVAKASQISQQILKFSRLEGAEESVRVDMCQFVVRTSQLIKGAIPSECDFSWIVPSAKLEVLGGEARLAQILINLIVNARDALDGRGTICAELEAVHDRVELEHVFHSSELPSDAYARLRVVDTGQGMPDEIVARIFEPYFSTKADRGTGLGLTTVKSIVAECGGAIHVNSKVGHGTTFSVYLPLIKETDTSAATTDEEDSLPRGCGESLLVVDDEHTVRNVLRLSLEHLGYVVTTATTGDEAITCFQEASKSFDLVVLDMIMPGKSGDEVFAHIRKLDPKVRTLLISGFSSERAVNEALENGALDYLPKPFTMEVLADKVRRCLDAR